LRPPSGIVSTDPIRPRTHWALDVAADRSIEVRADVAINNESSETMQIGTKSVAHRGAPFQQVIANRFVLRGRA
jgi:hypothetical protein